MRDEIIREIEQFLYREARLLDDRKFHEWLELLTEDIRYWMPVRTNRYPVTSKAISILDGSRYEEGELSKEGELAIMDEDKDSLTRRAFGHGHSLALSWLSLASRRSLSAVIYSPV